jgi:colicin import membrane protein
LPTALALLVHALLVVALTWGVTWKQTPESVLDTELWSALPQVAAPAVVEPPTEAPTEPKPEPEAPEPEPEPEPAPPPPPPAAKAPSPAKPDIVAQKKAQDERKAKEQAAKDKAAKEKLAKDRAAKDKAAKDLQAKKKLVEDKAKKDKAAKEQAAKDKAAKEQAEKEKAEKDQAAADAKRREAQRKEQINRMLGQAGNQGNAMGNAAGNAAANSGPSASYGGRVAASIKPNVVLADPVVGNPRAEVEVRADADGKITSRRLVKSSGNPTWDQAVLRAIDRTGTLPRDTDGRVPSALIIGLRPQD